MNNLGKVLRTGAVFVAGYLVGFYEFKYKATRAMLECMLEKDEEEEEESQE